MSEETLESRPFASPAGNEAPLVAPVSPPAAPQFPPPQVQQFATAGPTAPPGRRRGGRAVIIASIVAGSALLIGAVVAGSFALGALVTEAIASAGDVSIDDGTDPGPVGDLTGQPPIVGDASSPRAVNPTQCPGSCFTAAVVGRTIASDIDLAALGVPTVLHSWGETPSSTPQGEYRYAADYWTSETATPDECFFLATPAPVAIKIDERPGPSMDGIYFTGTQSTADEYSTLTSVVRLFPDTGSAAEHMQTLDAMVRGCAHYEMGTGSSYWTADVTQAPQIAVPDTVAASGWVEVSPFGRYYVFDMQRANVVVRSTVFTDGGITEQAFHEYLEELAVTLDSLDPTAG